MLANIRFLLPRTRGVACTSDMAAVCKNYWYMAVVCKNFWRCSSSSALFKAVSKVKSTSEELTGHSDVLQAQQMVSVKKEELREWRQKLADATESYEHVQGRLKGLYTRKAQVYQDQRRDLAAIQAVNDEEESLLKLEQSHFFELEKCQQKERECFESLSDAIQESHEKERTRTEQMKYYTRLGSLLGAVFGFLGSNMFLRREIRQHNKSQAEKMETIETALLQIQKYKTRTIKEQGEDVTVSSSQADVKPTIQKLEQSLQLAETKVDQLSAAVERNAAILKEIYEKTLPLKESHATSVSTPSSLQQPSFIQDSHSSDVIAVTGVIAYSVLLALFSLFR